MKKRILTGLGAAIVLLFAGCDGSGGTDSRDRLSPEAVAQDSAAHAQVKEKETVGEIVPQMGTESESEANRETTAEQKNDTRAKFSYLQQLSPEKQAAYNQFAQSRDLGLLTDFTPEDMVLAYFHTISISDPYVLYPLIYNGGYLSDPARFSDEYNRYVSNYDSETAMHYRYYDSIQVDEQSSKADYKAVITTISVGSHTHSMALGLREEDGVWKLDLYHLMKEQIKKGKAADVEAK